MSSLLVVAGCAADTGPGALSVLLEPEASITGGIAAGTALEDIVDGWSVTFTKYVVAVGGVRLARTDTGDERTYPATRVVDLVALPTSGYVLVDEPSIPSGRWDLVSYDLIAPTVAAVREAGVAQADFDAMVSGGCTYLIEGSMTNPSGQSCPVGGSCRSATSLTFRFCVPATVSFDNCAAESGLPGLVVTAASSSTVAFTFHGDHLFFSSFPAGAEIVERRAQWLADSDTNADGTVDAADLAAVDTPQELSAVFPSASYNLANAPGGAIASAFDFVLAQLRTQGHFQGEGECAFTLPP